MAEGSFIRKTSASQDNDSGEVCPSVDTKDDASGGGGRMVMMNEIQIT